MQSSRRLKIGHALLWTILLLAPAARLLATDDEGAWGEYRGTCPSVTVSFRMDADGVSSIKLDGTRYGKAELGEYGRFGSLGLYMFSVQDGPSTKVVDFVILFDEDETVKAVSGFYSAWASQRREGSKAADSKLGTACTLTMVFAPAKR
jgi:hypothetical protein